VTGRDARRDQCRFAGSGHRDPAEDRCKEDTQIVSPLTTAVEAMSGDAQRVVNSLMCRREVLAGVGGDQQELSRREGRQEHAVMVTIEQAP
jgi:hypothetical protein